MPSCSSCTLVIWFKKPNSEPKSERGIETYGHMSKKSAPEQRCFQYSTSRNQSITSLINKHYSTFQYSSVHEWAHHNNKSWKYFTNFHHPRAWLPGSPGLCFQRHAPERRRHRRRVLRFIESVEAIHLHHLQWVVFSINETMIHLATKVFSNIISFMARISSIDNYGRFIALQQVGMVMVDQWI